MIGSYCALVRHGIRLKAKTITSIILSWICKPPSLSAGPFSTIFDTKIPSFEVPSLLSCNPKTRQQYLAKKELKKELLTNKRF